MERAGKLLGKVHLPADTLDPVVNVRAVWRRAVGKKIDEHARPKDIVRTTLIVEVADIVWQRQLHALKHFLIRNLNDALGGPFVTEIDFRPLTPRMKPQRAERHLSEPVSPPVPAKRSNEVQDPVMALLYRQSKNRNTA